VSCRRFTVAALAMFLLSALPPAAQAQSGPSISIDDVSKPEGDIVNGFTFTVSLSAPSSQTVTVKRATADGTAIADEGYLPLFANGPVVTFSPGQTSKQVTVDVIGDIHTEVDEDFFVNLSDAANATISDGQGRGVIQTDDMTTGAFFTTTNGDFAHFWTPPPGVTAATFRMTGARGGGLLGGSGGNFRATLTGLHRPLLICLGGRGFGDLLMGQTNFVTGGGGAAVLGGFTGAGATDVRISDDCTVNTDRRLLVAGGGGGQGGDAIFCDRRYENTGGSAPPCRLDATHFDWRCAGDPKPECVRVLGGHGGSAASLDASGGTSATDGSPHHGGHGDLVVTAPERGRNGGELANGSGGRAGRRPTSC
jgi:Calx-beta domain